MGSCAVTAAQDPQTVRSLMSQPQPSAIAGASHSTHMQYSRLPRQSCQESVENPCRVAPYKSSMKTQSQGISLSVWHPSLQLLEDVLDPDELPTGALAVTRLSNHDKSLVVPCDVVEGGALR